MRNAVLAPGWPESVPGTTVDRQCGSSQHALDAAVHAIMAGAHGVMVAGGVEHMTSAPLTTRASTVEVYGTRMVRRYQDRGGMPELGVAADRLADRLGFTRDELDERAFRSHQRAAAAADAGHFERQVVAPDGGTPRDEGIRRGSWRGALAALRPVFSEDGTTTAGNASQIADGARALLVMTEDRAGRLGLDSLARVAASAVVGSDPVEVLTGPAPATAALLRRAGLGLDDIDWVEVNEAFAVVVLAWCGAVGLSPEVPNPDGGAIALGHPLGCSGSRILTDLVDGLRRVRARWGLQVMCGAGGMANATVVEAL